MKINNKLSVLIFILGMILNNGVFAAEQSFVVASVGRAKVAKQKIIIAKPVLGGKLSLAEKKIAEKFTHLLINNFQYYRSKYEVLGKLDSRFPYEKRVNYKKLKARNIDILIQTRFYKSKNQVFVQVKSLNVLAQKSFYSSQFVFELAQWRKLAHGLADRIYRGLNEGRKSIFKDKIIFVSDVGSRKLGHYKELYLVDFDGEGRKRLTFHKGIVISPAVSPDGKKILYSLIDLKMKKKNINLMMLNLVTGKVSLISDKKGINSGAVFTGDGKSILLTMSFNGNADIYEMRLDSKELTQITGSKAADVDPSINGNGSAMSFLSDRSGRAMVYSLDLKRAGAKPRRVTYIGKFNATPRYSPDGKDIVFASWLDRGFDLFRIKSNGSELMRLTKNFGSNEEPSFSFDNEFILFSSKRVLNSKRVKDSIYLMTRDGEIIKEVVKNFGAAITPRWLR